VTTAISTHDPELQERKKNGIYEVSMRMTHVMRCVNVEQEGRVMLCAMPPSSVRLLFHKTKLQTL
jgi:hypothetical protein